MIKKDDQAKSSRPGPMGAAGPKSDASPPPVADTLSTADMSSVNSSADVSDDGDVGPGPGILRKLNPKDIMGSKIRELPIPSDLYTIIGRANNLRDGESNFGPWTSLRGEFEATRLHDNISFISSECFVPGPAGDLLVAQVRMFIEEEIPVTTEQYKKAGKTYKVTGEYVEMALVISTKPSSRDGGQPYEFVVRPIVKVQRADPLAALREKMKKSIPMLALQVPKEVPGAPVPKPAELPSAPATTTG